MGPSALILGPWVSGWYGLRLGAYYHSDHSPFSSHTPGSSLCLTLSPLGNCHSLISSSFFLSWLTDPLPSVTKSSILSKSEVQSDPSTNLALSPWTTFISFLTCSPFQCHMLCIINPLHPSFSCLPQQQVILCAQFLGKTKVTRRELTQDLTSPASPALVPTLCALLPGTKGCTPTQTSGPSLLTHQEHHVTSPPTATGLHPLLFLPIGTDMPEFLFP